MKPYVRTLDTQAQVTWLRPSCKGSRESQFSVFHYEKDSTSKMGNSPNLGIILWITILSSSDGLLWPVVLERHREIQQSSLQN
jgi:hypothetical protein